MSIPILTIGQFIGNTDTPDHQHKDNVVPMQTPSDPFAGSDDSSANTHDGKAGIKRAKVSNGIPHSDVVDVESILLGSPAAALLNQTVAEAYQTLPAGVTYQFGGPPRVDETAQKVITDITTMNFSNIVTKQQLVSSALSAGSAIAGAALKSAFSPASLKFSPSNQISNTVGTSEKKYTNAYTEKDTSGLIGSYYRDGIIPVRFNKDNDSGFLRLDRGQKEPVIKDNDAYVPLSFTDLRPIGNSFRSVYFRPFITNLSEDFSPEWSLQNYAGRVDPVATYQSTGRRVNLAFKIVAFDVSDVPVIYQKLTWLTSMVYPEFDANLLYKSGPVIRMRVGNVIDGIGIGGRGLPGIITNLTYDYTDALWELATDMKVPRNVNVVMSFQVLHDKPIGRGESGKFGGLGSFDSDGLYIPPAPGDNSPGQDNSKSPQVNNGMDSFRAFSSLYDPNNYSDELSPSAPGDFGGTSGDGNSGVA